MTEISKSPERGSFHLNGYTKRLEDPNTTDEDKKSAQSMIDFYARFRIESEEIEMTKEWQKNNMEYDLRTTDWILKKVRESDIYAQNLYAAMCNMQFVKLEVIPILKEERWSCSWRHSGGIIADMQVKGDYIDWYCSGMGGLSMQWDEDKETFEQWQVRTKYVPEGTVTEEIKEDLKKLGWVPIEWPDDE
jgi:hypothetical protein